MPRPVNKLNNATHPGKDGEGSVLRIGSLVECINAAPLRGRTIDGLEVGKLYRVRWAGRSKDIDGSAFEGVRLEEITGRKRDLPYNSSRFRSVDDARLALFRAVLASSGSGRKVEGVA